MMPAPVDPAAAAAREWDDWSMAEATLGTPAQKRMRTVAVQVADGVLEFSESGSPASCSTRMVEDPGLPRREEHDAAPGEGEVQSDGHLEGGASTQRHDQKEGHGMEAEPHGRGIDSEAPPTVPDS